MLDQGYLTWSRHHRTLPGRGAFPLGAFVSALRATGYDGVVSLECFSDQLRAEPAGIVAKAGFEVLDQLWDDHDGSFISDTKSCTYGP